MNELNTYNETATLESELQEAAFEYLLLNPSSEFDDWQQGLISDYPAEVVDASLRLSIKMSMSESARCPTARQCFR